jgi:phosphoenolpyruvate carboxykinase (ATP)
MDLAATRAMVRAAISGALDDVPYRSHPVYNLDVPTSCPGVPSELLDPRRTWADTAAYDRAARGLARRFEENFARFQDVPEAVRRAGPRA